MSNNRGIEPAPKKYIAMGGTRLPKETSGGGGEGSGSKGKKAGDIKLPFGSGKANTAPKA